MRLCASHTGYPFWQSLAPTPSSTGLLGPLRLRGGDRGRNQKGPLRCDPLPVEILLRNGKCQPRQVSFYSFPQGGKSAKNTESGAVLVSALPQHQAAVRDTAGSPMIRRNSSADAS